MSKVAIYARISTQEQTLDQQIESCVNYCNLKNWEYQIFKEIGSSVKHRPVFEELKKKSREGEFKAIVVFRLDRGWRSSRQFIMDFDNLKARGVNIIRKPKQKQHRKF